MRSTFSKCINVTVVQSNHYATLVELVNNPTIIPILSMEKPQSNSRVIEGKIYIWLISFEFFNFIWQHQFIIKLWTKFKCLVPHGIYRYPIQGGILIFIWMNDSNSTNLLSSRSTEIAFFGQGVAQEKYCKTLVLQNIKVLQYLLGKFSSITKHESIAILSKNYKKYCKISKVLQKLLLYFA